MSLRESIYKQAITACNHWMVDREDCLLTMVWRDYGGTYQTLQYAKLRNTNYTLDNLKCSDEINVPIYP